MAGLRATSVIFISELEIDCDKDWLGRGITNIKEVVLNMTHGAITHRGPVRMENIAHGTDGQFLQTQGGDHRPVWWRSR